MRCSNCGNHRKIFISGRCWYCSYLSDESREEEMKQRTESVSKKQVPMDVYSTDKNFTGDKSAGQSDTFTHNQKNIINGIINDAFNECSDMDEMLLIIVRKLREL